MIREGRVIISSASRPAFGSGYYITAYEPGAQVAQGSASTTVTVRAGHGLATDDYVMVCSSSSVDTNRVRKVDSVTATTVLLDSAMAVASGEFLCNLGPDSGQELPVYDGSGVVIYHDMDYTTAANDSTVIADTTGRYRYFHKGIQVWELVRTSTGTPVALYINATVTQDEDPVSYDVRYAHLFPSALGHLGTLADPFPGAAIQEAYDDLPVSGVGGGGIVRMIPGIWDLGSSSIGLNFDCDGVYSAGITIEGYSGGNEFVSGNALANDNGTVLIYSGTGEAIRIGSFSTVNSQWMEGSKLKNFKLRQSGTAGTGIGILARLFRWGLFEDVTVHDFSVGIALASVSDFNQFMRVRTGDCTAYHIDLGRSTDAAGNALGGTVGQCNANRFYGCDIKNSVRDLGYSNWGIYIHNNTTTNVIRDSEFHNFDTATYGAIYHYSGSFDSRQTVIDSNYFEGNDIGIYHHNPAAAGVDAWGISVTNNWIIQTENVGVWINDAIVGALTKGVTITGNTFWNPSSSAPYATSVGIKLNTSVSNTFLAANTFVIGHNPSTYTFPGGNVVTVAGNALEIIDDTIVWRGMYQSKMIEGSNSEEITLSTSGLTTDSSANLLPANSIILGVTARVTTTITTTTNWAMGDSVTSARFSSASTALTANDASMTVGLNHMKGGVATDAAGPTQVSAAPLRITCTGSNPGAGKIRVTVFYRTFSAATS